MIHKGHLIITAASDFLVSDFALEQKILSRCVNYYQPLDLDTILAVPLGGKSKLASQGEHSLKEVQIVEIPQGTKGALATAIFAASAIESSKGQLHVAAGDTYFEGNSALQGLKFLSDSTFEAGTLVFPSQDARHSYVALDSENRVQLVAEKSAISPNATSGNFYFSEIGEFRSAAEWCFVNNAALHDAFYVSSALNYFVYQGKEVGVSFMEPTEVRKFWNKTPVKDSDA